MSENLVSKTRNAAKWSLITESASKIVIPITQLILARILAPEVFGIVATVVMVTSFAEMLSDAGFQKYLVQSDFSNKRDLYQAANVAFWASLSISIVIWGLIAFFRNELAALAGNPGLGVPLAVASVSLPISVFVGTQQALFRRAFEYKKLLPVRIAVAIIPLIVSVPLALIGFDYWALIIGTLVANAVYAISMNAISPWKPGFIFSFSILRKMFGFSSWSLLESISIWASVWAGTFIVGNLLSPYDLGLYRQPMLVVNSLFALVTNATTPILFAALSRLKSDRVGFIDFFLQFQFIVSLVLFPIGVGAFFYREFFTELLFGNQWSGASLMFGAWALATSFAIVFSHYCSEIYRALGKPRISFLSQCIYITVMVPTLYLAAVDGFTTLVIVNAGVRIVAILINQVITYLLVGIGFIRVIRNLYIPLIGSIAMGLAALRFSEMSENRIGLSFVGIVSCGIIYILGCLCFPRTRAIIKSAIRPLKK